MSNELKKIPARLDEVDRATLSNIGEGKANFSSFILSAAGNSAFTPTSGNYC